jgi:type II secretory pathway predicted ATPase ExeA
MYVAHFGLRHRPFRPAPDPAAYYPATTHETALQQIQQALADEEGLALLTGEPGTGKTLVAAMLVEKLADTAACVYLTNGHLAGPSDLFQAILYDLGEPYERKCEQELRLSVTDGVLKRFAEGRRTILLLDEAHHLSPSVLEELRQLGNLETRDGKAVQAILFALPEIDETLRRPDLRAFRQRLTARATLERLPTEEAADYLVHHLRVAGARPEAIVSDEAVELIVKASNGLPRLINQAMHLALELTCQAGEGRMDAEGALEALSRLGLEAAEEEPAAALATSDPPRLVYRPGLSG